MVGLLDDETMVGTDGRTVVVIGWADRATVEGVRTVGFQMRLPTRTHAGRRAMESRR